MRVRRVVREWRRAPQANAHGAPWFKRPALSPSNRGANLTETLEQSLAGLDRGAVAELLCTIVTSDTRDQPAAARTTRQSSLIGRDLPGHESTE